jgi:mRNA-degrading endonuclease toxin of MazEF toxin-antitoxin module
MPTFKQGDVVKVPFPYTDRSTRQSRPALVVSTGGIEAAHGLLWVVMITSAENRGWPGDVSGNLPCLARIYGFVGWGRAIRRMPEGRSAACRRDG